jgi:hypothetical protein
MVIALNQAGFHLRMRMKRGTLKTVGTEFSKESVMKKVIFIACILCVIWIGTASSFSAPAESGRVNDVSTNFIVIESQRYLISPKCKVFIQYAEGDSMHQKPGRIVDVRRGDSLIYYKIANTVTEFTIVR